VVLVSLVPLLVVAGCSSTGKAHAATPVSRAPAISLKSSALALARAYLTGTPDDIAALQGSECLAETRRPTPEEEREAVKQLEQLRSRLQQRLGVAPNAIKFRGVKVRNLTGTSGEAEVQYDLPKSLAVGNDNWVIWKLRAGKWKVSDCHLPIGGYSESSSGEVTTTSNAAGD
jgi:hypothetical protein